MLFRRRLSVLFVALSATGSLNVNVSGEGNSFGNAVQSIASMTNKINNFHDAVDNDNEEEIEIDEQFEIINDQNIEIEIEQQQQQQQQQQSHQGEVEHESHEEREIEPDHENHFDHHNDQEDDRDDHDDHSDDENHDDHDHEEQTEEENDKPWSDVIIASLLINCASLIGLIAIVGGFSSMICSGGKNDEVKTPTHESKQLSHNVIPSFACGALIATCVFLIIPEAMGMIRSFFDEDDSAEGHDAHQHRTLEDLHDDHDDHGEHQDVDVAVAWRFGVSIISGFLLPVVSSFIFPHYHEPDEHEEAPRPATSMKMNNGDFQIKNESRKDEIYSKQNTIDEGDSCSSGSDNENHDRIDEARSMDKNVDVKFENHVVPKTTPINYSLAASVLLGDFFHNFTDGILLGTAFRLCGRSLAVSIAAATIYHELAQELADYFLLTEHGNIKPVVALVLNFIGGLSVMLGAVLILAVDMSSNATGCILSLGGGVYIYIAGVECWSRVSSFQRTTKDKVYSLMGFVVGVVPIGLVLLNHGHCEA